ncbi:WD repeat-containing protein 89 [Thoreauomyces humboldtii]|nr:WD repeat-containing protein 89 [Thoreauomyces humboldtii]
MTSTQYTPFRLTSKHALPQTGQVQDVLVSPQRDLVAAPTSTGSIHIFDATTLAGLNTFQATEPGASYDVLCQVAFDTVAPHMLWTGSSSGEVKRWDVRNGEADLIFNAGAPVASIAINSNATFLAAGTELKDEDANIVIWDLRNPTVTTPAVTFTEYHSDDVTQLKFHPIDPLALISGSTDGLISLINLSTFDEDDALYQVIKEDSVAKCGFFGPSYEYIYSLSHMETFSLYKFEDGDKVFSFGDVREREGDVKVEYLIDCVYDQRGGRMFLVGGDQSGSISILHVNLGCLDIVHTLNGGHADIVRGVYWNVEKNTLVSGAEDGSVCLWSNA